MTQTLTLPSDVYDKLVQGAADRGMTIESLLAAVSELVALPDQPTERDRQRSDCIGDLLERFRLGKLSAEDRLELDELIEEDYQAANARADQLIAAKQRRGENRPSPTRKPNESSRSGKRPQK